MIPSGRSSKYAIWRTCERFGVLPPNVRAKWDQNTPATQSEMLSYNDLRSSEEIELAMGGFLKKSI